MSCEKKSFTHLIEILIQLKKNRLKQFKFFMTRLFIYFLGNNTKLLLKQISPIINQASMIEKVTNSIKHFEFKSPTILDMKKLIKLNMFKLIFGEC